MGDAQAQQVPLTDSDDIFIEDVTVTRLVLTIQANHLDHSIPTISGLVLVGLLYGALLALAQRDTDRDPFRWQILISGQLS